ncbi:class I adenylate-forming enzyme family protein [Dactylosporangium sp. NPDC000555]|uniref:class I adenylate-forming enzyme family protein n=1 Tax=Dactylosporangium sp. NPDC000555 TaxID=3154260 RepID=UPI003333AB47
MPEPSTVADFVRGNDPGGVAFHAPEGTFTWRDYDELSSRLARSYVEAGFLPGERLAVLVTGGALTHVAYLAAQKAGLVTVGIGPRAGDAEITHLLRKTGAVALATRATHRGRPGAEIAARCGAARHVVLDLDALPPPLPSSPAGGRGIAADDVFFLNSTSGTTGVPKVVRQTMDNRKYFGPLAHAAGRFGPDEVFASVLPAPYGFGLWSAHVVPAMYGYPTVLTAEFDAAQTLRLIAEHRVTVLCAVTAQFIMLLNDPGFAAADLSSLRVLFTGGERVPVARAREFEERTGCAVLQFYGSNEAGPISVTTVDDPPERRLATAGRPIPAMRVRLLAGGEDAAEGQVAANGPGCTPGYLDDEAANAALFRPDGWLLTGDLGAIDEDGYLSITGRIADFIIRGGHNVSALVVEEAVASHPAVAAVAVVAAPDPVLGERACAYVVTRAPLSLDDLRGHLDAGGVTKQNWPERLVALPELPLGTGGKVDKAALRADAAARFATAPGCFTTAPG